MPLKSVINFYVLKELKMEYLEILRIFLSMKKKKKINGCKSNPENSSATKVSEHIPSGFSMSTVSLFRNTKNKHDVYRGKEHAMKIINFKKKKMKLLTKEQQELYENTKICYICTEKFENKYLNDKKYCKV